MKKRGIKPLDQSWNVMVDRVQ